MRWFCLIGVSLLGGCRAAEVQSQQLKDGSWSFSCELSMDECLRRAQERCENQRYRILEGTSATKLSDVPPFEKAYHTSQLHLMCTHDGAEPLFGKAPDPSSPTKPPAKPAQAKPAATCSPGETRTCVGPGACQGGQACLPNGAAFGSCDCGNSTPPANAAVPAASAPMPEHTATPPATPAPPPP